MFVRALAAVLGAASLALLVHSVANPLYDDQVNAGAIWDTLSWIMAVGFPLALVVTYRLKTEATASEAASAGAILSTVAFYVTAFVAVVFFRIFISSLVHVEAEDAISRIYIGSNRRVLRSYRRIPCHPPLAKTRLDG